MFPNHSRTKFESHNRRKFTNMLKLNIFLLNNQWIKEEIPREIRKYFEMNENEKNRDFPGGPVVKTLHFHCRGKGSIPGWGTKIPHATPHGQKKERKKKLGKEYKNMINISPHKIYKWPINT